MTDPAWYPAPTDKELILDFILWFSRIEYALKSADSFSTKNKNHFQANWDKFKNEIARQPFPQELSDALKYIKNKPPLKQTGFTEWELVQGCCDWDYTIRALKTVRNNLFHGGKHHTGPVLQPVRDRELLIHCLSILKTVAPLLPSNIKTIFDGE